MKKPALVALAGAVSALGIINPVASNAAVPNCNGILNGPVSGSVTVPAGSICTIQNATVTGSVVVKGGEIHIHTSTIDGSLTVAGISGFSNVVDSTIKGSVTIEDGPSGKNFSIGRSMIPFFSTIGGSVTIRKNAGFVGITAARIGGAVTVKDKQGGGNYGNMRIGGSLSCTNNTPDPMQSGNVQVTGAKTGECSGFTTGPLDANI